jgi:hypothetical protein
MYGFIKYFLRIADFKRKINDSGPCRDSGPAQVQVEVPNQQQAIWRQFDWQRFGRYNALDFSAHSTWGQIRFPVLPTSWEPELAPSKQQAIRLATIRSVQVNNKGFDWQRFGRDHALESSAHSTWGQIRFPQLPTSWEPELAPSNQSAIGWQRFDRYK